MSKKNLSVIRNTCGFENFDWPEFNSDTKRIKALSRRYKQMNIVDAFADYYNMSLSNINPLVNETPPEIRLGNIITTKILMIDKEKVLFDTVNFKTNIQSSVNLYKYEKFKHFLPMDEINVVVTRVDKDKIVVDPITPMLESWLYPYVKDPVSQKKITSNFQSNATPIKVKIKELTRGGFMGRAVIPNVSEFVGEDYTIDAFIPGSQIVLNITDNFEKFVGETVDAFVVNYIQKPGTKNEMSLICSAKDVIKFNGEVNMINIFNSWCEESNLWKEVEKKSYQGKVTGVINSAKKCGVFVEIPELSITGMVTMKPEELVNYKPHSNVEVKLAGFEEEMFYDSVTDQQQHVIPYEIEDGVLKKCNLKPILQFA